MGLEHRNGRVYYYRSRRVGGRVRREYAGAGEAALMFARWDEMDRDRREGDAWLDAAERREADAILAAGAEADRLADRVFRAVMHLTGHAQHKRGAWRRTRGVKAMATIHDTGAPPRSGNSARPAPPPLDAETREIIAMAGRSAPMVVAFRELLKSPTALESLGYPAVMARSALVGMLASNEPSIAASVLARCESDLAKLLAECGPDPSFAEWMAAMRVVNGWLTVHALEALQGTTPSEGTAAAALDRRLTQAEKRLHAALKSLAVLRRLRKPDAVKQVNIAKGGSMVVNNGTAESKP